MNSIYKVILVLFLCQINPAWAEADQGRIPQEWIKLLHYEKQQNGSFESLIKDPDFFVYNHGSVDPDQELKSNLNLFNVDPGYNCKFPARAKFIAIHFSLTYSICAKVETWKNLISAESISYVSVGQYASTPASAFGHSFIIFKNSKKPMNLNLSLNYAAEMPPVVSAYDYLTKGIMGGFYGIFDIEPLYIKLQEYSAIENREMWAYDLDFNSYELDQFLNHIWELTNQIKESYYFLNGNCAVSLYNSLAAIHPDLEFIGSHRLYVLPVETIKRLEPISNQKTFIPSLREKIRQRYDFLNSDEKQSFVQFLKDGDLVSNSESIKATELELQYFEFLKTKREGQLTEKEENSYENALVKRSKLGPLKEEAIFTQPFPPHLSIPTWRIGLGLSQNSENIFSSLIFSPASHRLLQSESGYLPFSEITLFETKIGSQKTNTYFLEELTLFSLRNYAPRMNFDPNYSWTVKAQISREYICSECFYLNAELNVGSSLGFGDQLGYALVGFSDYKYRVFQPQIIIGTILKYASIRNNLQVRHIEPIHQIFEKIDLISFSTLIEVYRNFDLELNSELENRNLRGSIILNHYF